VDRRWCETDPMVAQEGHFKGTVNRIGVSDKRPPLDNGPGLPQHAGSNELRAISAEEPADPAPVVEFERDHLLQPSRLVNGVLMQPHADLGSRDDVTVVEGANLVNDDDVRDLADAATPAPEPAVADELVDEAGLCALIHQSSAAGCTS